MKLKCFQFILFALVILRLLLRQNDSPLLVAHLLKSLLLWFWMLCSEAANRRGFATVPHSYSLAKLCGDRSTALSHQHHKEKEDKKRLKKQITRQKHTRIFQRRVHRLFRSDFKASLVRDLFPVSTAHFFIFSRNVWVLHLILVHSETSACSIWSIGITDTVYSHPSLRHAGQCSNGLKCDKITSQYSRVHLVRGYTLDGLPVSHRANLQGVFTPTWFNAVPSDNGSLPAISVDRLDRSEHSSHTDVCLDEYENNRTKTVWGDGLSLDTLFWTKYDVMYWSTVWSRTRGGYVFVDNVDLHLWSFCHVKPRCN